MRYDYRKEHHFVTEVRSPLPLVHYLDESGHDTMFDKHGRVIVGHPGCSKTFIVGAAHICDVDGVDLALSELRARLLACPILSKIPSLAPSRGKTAIFFHAKDDHRLVREQVFEVIKPFKVRISAAFRRKAHLAWAAVNRQCCGGDYEAGRHRMYDNLVMRLMKRRLKPRTSHHIVIANRFNRVCTAAIENALLRVDSKYSAERQYERQIALTTAMPSAHAGLQVVDYYLWALQRVLEKDDWTYFDQLQEGFGGIYDVDDYRNGRQGVWYAQGNPLTQEKLMPVVSS